MTVTASLLKGSLSCGFSSPNVGSFGRAPGTEGWGGPWGAMAGCVGDSTEGVKNQNTDDISSQQIDTGPLILLLFPLDMICIANG